jgi:hypothetical protein
MASFLGASINSSVIDHEKDRRISRNKKLIKPSTSLKSLNEIKKDLLGPNETRKLPRFFTVSLNSVFTKYDDNFETANDHFFSNLSYLPPELNVEDLSDLQQKNLLIVKENEELCNDIQGLIAENEDLFNSNERLKKMLYSQQEKINQLEEGLDDSLQAHQDEVSNKQVDSEFQLKFKLHAAVLENEQLKRSIQQLEQEQEDMLETIRELINEAKSLKDEHIKGMQDFRQKEFQEDKTFALAEEKTNSDDSTNQKRQVSLISSLNRFRLGNAASLRKRDNRSYQHQLRTDRKEKIKPLQKLLHSLPNFENSTRNVCDQFLVSAASESQRKLNQDLPNRSWKSVERNSRLLEEFSNSIDTYSIYSHHQGKNGCVDEDFLWGAEDNLLELQPSLPNLVRSKYAVEKYENMSKNDEDSSSIYTLNDELSDLSGETVKNHSKSSTYLNVPNDSGEGLLVGFGRTDG